MAVKLGMECVFVSQNLVLGLLILQRMIVVIKDAGGDDGIGNDGDRDV